MHVRAQVQIAGAVQGVFFRSFVRSEARMLSLRGWVRNLPGGQVEAVFEGDKDRVEEMIATCKRGPGSAGVESVTVQWEKAEGEFLGFEIR